MALTKPSPSPRHEETGFDFLSISDPYHPWISDKGHSPFVWSTLGGVATATEDIDVGVSAPTIRIHPAIYAHAAASAAAMFNGCQFYAGVGTDEKLNQHVLGDHWPEHTVRLEMLEEAVEVSEKLWTEEEVRCYGDYYTVKTRDDSLFQRRRHRSASLRMGTGRPCRD